MALTLLVGALAFTACDEKKEDNNSSLLLFAGGGSGTPIAPGAALSLLRHHQRRINQINTSGDTENFSARSFIWRTFNSLLPLRISETTPCEPISRRSDCFSPCSSIKYFKASTPE